MEKEENGVVERHWRFELEDIPASVTQFDLIQKYSSNQIFYRSIESSNNRYTLFQSCPWKVQLIGLFHLRRPAAIFPYSRYSPLV